MTSFVTIVYPSERRLLKIQRKNILPHLGANISVLLENITNYIFLLILSTLSVLDWIIATSSVSCFLESNGLQMCVGFMFVTQFYNAGSLTHLCCKHLLPILADNKEKNW